jgi:hypothetical protein
MADNQNLPAGASAGEDLPVGLDTATLALNDPPSTADSQAKAGAALADVVKQVGMAVADTQKRLNEIAANTATSLATTQVDVIAARSKVYDDNGVLTDERNLTMKLPLVNFIDPVNYEVSRVRIQGMFSATEIRTETSVGIQTNVTNQSGGLLLGPLAFGQTSYQNVSTDTEVGQTYHSDQAYGYVRMNAEIRPRSDIGVPRPNQLIHGPNLLLVPQEVKEDHQGGDPNRPVIARTVIIKLSYRRRADVDHPAGVPIDNQTFAIETPGLLWSFCDSTGRDENDPAYAGYATALENLRKTTNGELFLKVRRDFPPAAGNGAAPQDTSQQPFIVSARIGMVQNTVAVAI